MAVIKLIRSGSWGSVGSVQKECDQKPVEMVGHRQSACVAQTKLLSMYHYGNPLVRGTGGWLAATCTGASKLNTNIEAHGDQSVAGVNGKHCHPGQLC